MVIFSLLMPEQADAMAWQDAVAQFHAFAVHAGGCVQQDVEACIDGNGFRLLDEDLWVSCLDSEQLCRVEPPSC